MYFLSFKEAAANKKLLDHNLKEKRVQLIRNQALAIAIQKGKRKVSSNRGHSIKSETEILLFDKGLRF